MAQTPALVYARVEDLTRRFTALVLSKEDREMVRWTVDGIVPSTQPAPEAARC